MLLTYGAAAQASEENKLAMRTRVATQMKALSRDPHFRDLFVVLEGLDTALPKVETVREPQRASVSPEPSDIESVNGDSPRFSTPPRRSPGAFGLPGPTHLQADSERRAVCSPAASHHGASMPASPSTPFSRADGAPRAELSPDVAARSDLPACPWNRAGHFLFNFLCYLFILPLIISATPPHPPGYGYTVLPVGSQTWSKTSVA